MGPPRAGEIIRQGLYRGADEGWLLTDRKSAGADTLATSYFLAKGIEKIGNVDIVIGGRQAIDGDTAQVGPQVAQKLGLNQVTYAEEVVKIEDGKATIRRHIDSTSCVDYRKWQCRSSSSMQCKACNEIQICNLSDGT